MAKSANVVVIGAGIQGLSAAYHLARIGIKNVLVVEKDSIGSGSSGRSASMLMLQRENRHKIELSLYSYRRYMEFELETGVSPRFKRIGFLSVVPESKLDEALQRAVIRQEMGVTTHVLSPTEITALAPAVNVDDIRAGVFGPDDGVIDAVAIMRGYSSAARQLGVTIQEGVRATGIELDGRALRGVRTSQGFVSTATVVNAAGAEASEVGSWVGINIPILNRARCIYVTAPFIQIPEDAPMVEDAEAEWYFRKEGQGVLMGMGKEEIYHVLSEPNLEFLPKVLAFAQHRVPILGAAVIEKGWSGMRPLTLDLNPILGPVDGVDGFINSCGWGGEGVMHAPAGGQIVAECVAANASSSFDIQPFLLSRFENKSLGSFESKLKE